MVKFTLALLMAVIAALTIGVAGLISGARISTILLRGLGGWFVALLVVWLVLFIVETKGWMGFDRNIELMAENEQAPEDGEPSDASDAQMAQAGAETGEAASPQEEQADAAGGFQPLQAQQLQHMEVPSDSEAS